MLAAVATTASSWRRYVAPAIFLLALTALALGAARPQVTVDGDRENATVVLAIDTSGSMMATDVPPTRMAAAQAALRTFLDDLPAQFRVGAVAFSAEPQVIAPVTRDRALVRESLDFLEPLRGTAIGDALARATELAAEAIGRRPPGDQFVIAYGTPIGTQPEDDPSRSPRRSSCSPTAPRPPAFSLPMPPPSGRAHSGSRSTPSPSVPPRASSSSSSRACGASSPCHPTMRRCATSPR